jgi:hypothetical protein
VYYQCQIFDKDGKIIEERHVEVSVGAPVDASNNEKVKALKRKAQLQGFGFRVTRCE